MTIWNLYLITDCDVEVAIFDTNLKEFLWKGRNADMPSTYMHSLILSINVNRYSKLIICI
jgi:hypothetical protein